MHTKGPGPQPGPFLCARSVSPGDCSIRVSVGSRAGYLTSVTNGGRFVTFRRSARPTPSRPRCFTRCSLSDRAELCDRLDQQAVKLARPTARGTAFQIAQSGRHPAWVAGRFACTATSEPDTRCVVVRAFHIFKTGWIAAQQMMMSNLEQGVTAYKNPSAPSPRLDPAQSTGDATLRPGLVRPVRPGKLDADTQRTPLPPAPIS